MKKTVLIIHTTRSTFVQKDIDAISKKHNVISYYFHASKSILDISIKLMKLFFFLVLRIRKIDIVISWFCDFHTLLPMLYAKMFNKKSFIIIGGFDAVSLPHLNYGLFVKKDMRNRMARLAYLFADILLPVDASLIKGLNVYGDPSGKGYPVGVRSFIPTMHAEVYVLPTGYDSNFWSNPHSIIHNKNSVLSVAFVSNEKVFRLKGFDLLLAAAKLLPDFEFTLVGLSGKMLEYVKNNSGKNVKVEPPIKNNELPAFFSRHHIYAQLSESEGLPNSLCEAMLCECIPVGSDVNGIPTGIGDTGFILKKRDAHMAAELFQKASEAGEDLGKKARNRIIAKFSNEQREYKLLRLIDNS